MAENCNSRGFSWLMKSCFPNPQQETLRETTYLIRNSDRTLSRNRSEVQNHSRQTPFTSLPDDLLLECLSRVSPSSLASVSVVCRRWSLLINSSAFLDLRRNLGHLRRTIFAFSVTDFGVYAANHTIGDESETAWKLSNPFNAIQTVNNSGLFERSFSHARLTAIGRVVFIINRDITLQYDTWTGNLTSRSPMLFPRKKFAAATIAGKIYISGGAARNEVVEEYEPETDTWRVVAEAPRRRYGCIGAAVDGVFYVIGGLKIGGGGGGGNECITRGGCSEAHLYASSMDLFDVQSGLWMRSRTVPGGGCVVAACAAGGYVYVLASHAVELSFWRYDGRRRRRSAGSGFGEWCRMKNPPLPAQVRVDSTVRFSCVGVGGEESNNNNNNDNNKVVLVQVVGCIDDLLRRSGRSCRGLKEGLVLVYDGEVGEWSRGVDLPEIIRRAACVCVEC
ncbi:F-box domain [Macleaya cordata]|uniref:F-box domain n=1 Tax=Macleaya cordata TaxID=56857 RepID=A0A200QWH8_MACCD|nr:F-box domain [Macleaya cordata]